MRKILAAIDARDVLFVVGGTLLTIGLAQIYVPSAYIVPGVGLIGLAVWRVKG